MTGLDIARIDTPTELLDWICASPDPQINGFLAPGEEITVARAPGRLDLMGGIADYSGSLVLQWPIREATWAAVQPTAERTIAIISARLINTDAPANASIALHTLLDADGSPLTYADVRRSLSANPRQRWAAYVAGVFAVLMRERGLSANQGARIAIVSDVPEGKGVSSSAAIEVASMRAVAEAFGIAIDGRELGLLCQKVENEVVGAPCGVMDQMTSSCGHCGALMALCCRPAELLGSIALPTGIDIWGIDSGVRHSICGADYGTVRAAAFMGLKIIETASGRALGGYLTNLSPSEMPQYLPLLPDAITGAEFTARYAEVGDPQSQVASERLYPVRAATVHPVHENLRVSIFRELVCATGAPARMQLLGELMYQSHASYSACGLGTPQTDILVDLVRELGPGSGLYGAKITGGGSGGTVAVLGESGADDAVRSVAERYARQTGLRPYIFTGTSPGAMEFGIHRMRKA